MDEGTQFYLTDVGVAGKCPDYHIVKMTCWAAPIIDFRQIAGHVFHFHGDAEEHAAWLRRVIRSERRYRVRMAMRGA